MPVYRNAAAGATIRVAAGQEGERARRQHLGGLCFQFFEIEGFERAHRRGRLRQARILRKRTYANDRVMPPIVAFGAVPPSNARGDQRAV